MHVVDLCVGEGKSVVGAGGDAREVLSRGKVVDVVQAVGTQAHAFDEVVAVAVLGEPGSVVLEPEEGCGGDDANRNHQHAQRHGEGDERGTQPQQARLILHGVLACRGAFRSLG